MRLRPCLAVLLCLVLPSLAEAQLRRASGGVMLPPLLTSSPDGAVAVEVNPAAISSLGGYQLYFLHSGGRNSAHSDEGDVFYAATPLPFGLGLGVGVERLDGAGAGRSGRFSLAGSYAPGKRGAVGFALRHIEGGALDGMTGVDLSFIARPSDRIAASLIVYDLLGPSGLVGLGGQAIPTSFVGSLAYRPFGYDYLSLEGLFGVDTDRRVAAGGALAVWVPYFGRLSARVTADDLRDTRDVRVVAGADVAWGGLGLFGGVAVGDGYGDGPGYYVGGTLGAQAFAGLPPPRMVLDVEARSGIGPRGILRLVETLGRAADDDRVNGVLLRLRDTGLGLAYAQELRQAVETLRAAGKPVLCHLESPTGAEIYVCAAADKTLLDPAGNVRLLGPSMDVLMLGGLLEKLGVRADFVRIGQYKSAPEQYTRSEMSEADRRQRGAFLDDVYGRMLEDLARSYGVDREAAAALIDGGPYAASQALETPMVQATADELDLDAPLADLVDGRVRRRGALRSVGPRSWGSGRRVGVVVVDGTIVDGENVDLPIIEIHQSGGRSVVEAIERFADDPSVGSIVVRVDSGGGSALASDQIWRAIRRAKDKKPVIASMGAMAASGGYYIASACDEIFTAPSTLTGSIGIFFGKVDFEPLLERVGVHPEQLARGRHAGATSLYRPFTDEERAQLREQIELSYQLFLSRVAEGRGMTTEAVDALGQGRIWSGDAAVGVGLVDELGGFASALARARELGRVPALGAVDYQPRRPSSLLDYVLTAVTGSPSGGASAGAEAEAGVTALPAPLRAAADRAFALSRAREGTGFAMVPLAVVAP